MRKKLLAALILAWACTAFAADYTIDEFSTGGKSIPPASNTIIESPGGANLVAATPTEPLKPGEIILRRRWGKNDYRIYKGRMTQSVLAGEANLSSFPFPEGMQRSDALRQKYYTAKVINPDQDASDVYCDDEYIYVEQARAIYWHKDDQWYELKASDLMGNKNKTKKTGSISVSTTPQGAQISIDSVNKGPVNGYIDGIFPGEHKIRVELEGYQTADTTIFIKSTDDLPQYSFNLVSALGALSFNSNPAGATVIFKGQKKGVTPYQINNQPPGRYPIRLEKEWYLPVIDTMTVTMNETTSVVKTLKPDFGSLSITSSPENAHVIIDGVDHGAAPVNIDRQPPGTFSVAVQADMYKRTDTLVTVNRGESVRLNIFLKPDFGTLTVGDAPEGCAYHVDNNGRDIVDETIRLSPGKHHVTLDGHGKYSNIDTMIAIVNGIEKKIGSTSQRLTGSIQVRPFPLDAEVFVDGVSKGTGGKTIHDVPTGEHSVYAIKTGFTKTTINVVVADGEMATASLNLPHIPDRDGDGVPDDQDECPDEYGYPEYNGCPGSGTASYEITSIPDGATLLENGKEKGTTALNITLHSGKHLLTLKRNSYLDTSFQINVNPQSQNSATHSFNFVLQPTQACIDSLKAESARLHWAHKFVRIKIFGIAAAVTAGVGYYFDTQYQKNYKTYSDDKNSTVVYNSSDQSMHVQSMDDAWNSAEKNRKMRNILYICGGVLASCCGISFVF